jgi:hypothetical protein
MAGFAMAAKAALALTLCALTLNEATVVVPRHSDGAPAANRSVRLDLHQLRPHFERSEAEHASSMSAIMLNMTPHSALEVLRSNKKVSPEFLAFAQTASTRTRLRASTHKKSKDPITIPSGYNSVDGAKYLLNALLEESEKKYDMEILKCRDYYSKQCGEIEASRGTIAASNQKGAACRTKILFAQSAIEAQEMSMPVNKQALTEHRQKCNEQIYTLRDKLKLIEGDVGTMSDVLGLTGCGGSTFLQTAQTSHHHAEKSVKLLRCQHKCRTRTDKSSFVSIDHAPLRHHMDKLKSHVAHALLQQSFGDLAGEQNWPEEQLNITMRRTSLPTDPCTDKYHGGPTPTDKRTAKCTVSGTASCITLNEHFGIIQGGLVDEQQSMHGELGELTTKCQEAEKTLSAEIAKQEQTLRAHQTKLAEATSCVAEASEEGRLSNMEFSQLTAELHKMKTGCSHNYQQLETEMCGLKKIRTEIYTKMGGSTTMQMFQDCKLSDWTAGECSASCGGGEQTMTRSVVMQPNGGASCLPLSQIRSCNAQPCPVDCKLSGFGGWSACSAECGGGIRQRLRDIDRPAQHGGQPCGEVSETHPCNVQACEADCELGDWTKWAACSKECDGGSRKRIKRIAVQAIGSGECPAIDSPDREQYKKCNAHPCARLEAKPTVTCKSKIDLIILLDGSGSLGEDGWAASKAAAKMLIEAQDVDLAQVALLLFSGPTNWNTIQSCMSPEVQNQETTCKMKWVTHLAAGSKTNALIALDALEWPKGNTLTSLALYNALSETQLSRQDAEAVVAVITDGKPFSEKQTLQAAQMVRKVARLMFIPVTTFAPLSFVRRMASRPVDENVIVANDFNTLQAPDFIDHVVADMCPVLDLPPLM